jgi:hypothetical protein
MNRFARDSRKWNVRVLLSSQIPADFLRIQGFVTLLDSVFVGRLDDEQAQADALRLLKVPVGAGYEQVIAALGRRPGGHRGTERDRSPRQFVFGDGAGGVERIRVDFSGPHLAHLVEALDTTPDALREVPAELALPPAPAVASNGRQEPRWPTPAVAPGNGKYELPRPAAPEWPRAAGVVNGQAEVPRPAAPAVVNHSEHGGPARSAVAPAELAVPELAADQTQVVPVQAVGRPGRNGSSA